MRRARGVSLRRLFVSVLVTFAVLESVMGGYLAWREASGAVEAQLDERASVVAGAAVETGLQASVVVGLEPGLENTMAWESNHARLRHLLRFVDAAYLVAPDNTALAKKLRANVKKERGRPGPDE